MKWLAALSVVCLPGSDMALAGTRSPVTVAVMVEQSATIITAEAASLETARLIGASTFGTVKPRLVRYSDRAAMGLAPEGTGWLVRGTVKLVSREPVAVNAIIDATTGRLAFAYTDSTGLWPVPMDGGGVDLSRMVREAGWDLGTESPDSMESTMTQVMEKSTHSEGADPTEVGQMIIRPRWNSPRLPARREGEELVPVRPTARVWIVQVCGRKQQHPAPPPPKDALASEFYSTEEFFQLKDGSLEFWGRFYLQ